MLESLSAIEVMKSHRSIRKFTGGEIPYNLLTELVKVGQSGSTSSHVQAYSIIRVKDKTNRKKISELAGGQASVVECAEFLVFCADIKRSAEASESIGNNVIRGMTEQLILATVDTAIVAQNVAIAAELHGLGICYIGGIRNDPSSISELLQIPEDVYPVFGMCLGYPASDPDIKPRLPTESVLKDDYYSGDSEEVDAFNKVMANYYMERKTGNKKSTWAEQLSPVFNQKTRPHMRRFLRSKGFGTK